jgi:hypothetical protein
MLSADPVQPNGPGTQGYNLYSYVANNPVTWVDPSGHQAIIAVPWGDLSSAALAALAGQVYTTLTAALANQATLAVTIVAFWATALILTCLLDVNCKEAFVSAVGAIVNLGSDIAVGVIDWTIDMLRDVWRWFPPTPIAWTTPRTASATQVKERTERSSLRDVILDTNAIISYNQARVFVLPGERPVVTPTVVAELADVAARKGFSGLLPPDVGLISDTPSAVCGASACNNLVLSVISRRALRGMPPSVRQPWRTASR